MYLYLSNIPRLSARHEIEKRKSDVELSEQGAYNLYLTAYEDPDLADKARAHVSYQKMKRESSNG